MKEVAIGKILVKPGGFFTPSRYFEKDDCKILAYDPGYCSCGIATYTIKLKSGEIVDGVTDYIQGSAASTWGR